MLKNQRKDTYQLCVQSLLLPPSFRFPPLREGNRARVGVHPRFARGTARGALTRFPLLAGGTLRRGSSTAVFFVNFGLAIGITGRASLHNLRTRWRGALAHFEAW